MRSFGVTKSLLALCLAASGVAMAGARSQPSNVQGRLDSASVSGWFLADFNGDLRPDLATAHTSLHDARGYSQEVRIDFGEFHQTSFAFRSQAANVELTAWDIDGDNDRDIVVREATSRLPIGVWLNDGQGSFAEADLSRFQKALAEDSPLWRTKPAIKGFLPVNEQRRQAVLPAISVSGPSRPAGIPALGEHRTLGAFSGSGFRNRAPPSQS